MNGFLATPDGWESRIDSLERDVLFRLFEDVLHLIAEDAPLPAPSAADPIAHLDFTPGGQTPGAEQEPALDRIFRPMSVSDPELASEMRNLTVEEIRRAKAANLRLIVEELDRAGETVRVRPGEEGRWLTALTDVRLVLSSLLGIDDEEDSKRVYELAVAATRDLTPAETLEDELEMTRASLYAGITWWQESLLGAVTGGGADT